MRDLPFYQDCYLMGKRAYEDGIKEVADARAENLYIGFGKRLEHARFVSWNQGWSDAKRAAEGI